MKAKRAGESRAALYADLLPDGFILTALQQSLATATHRLETVNWFAEHDIHAGRGGTTGDQ